MDHRESLAALAALDVSVLPMGAIPWGRSITVAIEYTIAREAPGSQFSRVRAPSLGVLRIVDGLAIVIEDGILGETQIARQPGMQVYRPEAYPVLAARWALEYDRELLNLDELATVPQGRTE